MQVKLTVPSDLGGASLLGVHNWIKSQVVRSNPGGSPDYTIMDMNGNQLTLSDVARNPNTEIMVNVIDGIKSNPQGYLAPVPGLEMEYPQIPRSGNDVMMLMPDDLDPTLVQRIVAEQGLNRGLHTLNRLLLMQSPGEAVSPQTAAILQMGDKLRMSRAVRSNPSDRTPFTQRTPHYYSPEAALGKYMREYMDADGVKVSEEEGRLIAADAKLANKYALNQAKIQVFARNVLAEYLFAASANRGLLRTIVRNNPDLREERELMQRLLAIFPQQPKAFYEGSVNVFVAHPLFIYPAYADTLLTNRQINTILDFARDYPHNMRGRRLPAGISGIVDHLRAQNDTRSRYWSTFLNFTIGRPYLTGTSNERLDSATLLDDTIDMVGLRAITERFAGDAEGRRQEYFRRFSPSRPLTYYSNLGGMYPTVPSKWPPALVYAIMDGFLEKLGEIVNMEDPAQFGFSPIRMTGRLRPAGEADRFMITVQDPFEEGRTFTLAYPADVQEIVQANYTFDALRGAMNAPFGQPGAAPQAARFRIPQGVVGTPEYPNNAAVRSAAAEAIERALREGHHQELSAGERDGNVSAETNIEITSTHQISLLEMAYHIAEIAQVKYNYNARGDDFMFIMAMCQISLESLQQQVAPAAPVNPLAGLIAPPPGAGGPGLIAPPVNALPGGVDVGNAVPHAPAVNAAAAQAEIENVINEGNPDEVADLGGILPRFRDLDVMPGFANLFNAVDEAAAQQPLNNPRRATVRSTRVERIKKNLEALQSINEQIDDRVVRALRSALSQDAHNFLDQVGQVSLRTVKQASQSFDSALVQLVATYKECIEQITDAIDDNFNSIFESEGKILKYNFESTAQIYQALNAADAMTTNAKLRFESKLEGFRDHTDVMRGIAGASPATKAAIERAIAVNTSSTDIIIELDTTLEFIQDAELILNSDGITGDGILRLYRALIMMIEKLAEMVNAINTLNKAVGRGEDVRSVAKIGKSFNEVLEVIEHDLTTLDPLLYKDQISALRAIRPNDNYPQIKANVDEAIAVL